MTKLTEEQIKKLQEDAEKAKKLQEEMEAMIAKQEADKVAREEAEKERLLKEAETATMIAEMKAKQEEDAKKMEQLMTEVAKGSSAEDIIKKQKEAERKRAKEREAEEARILAEKVAKEKDDAIAEANRRAEEAIRATRLMAKKAEIKDYMVNKPHIREDLEKIVIDENSDLGVIEQKLEFILEFKDTEKERARFEQEEKAGGNAFENYKGKEGKQKSKEEELDEQVKKDLEALANGAMSL